MTAGATLPTADAIRRGQLTAQIAGQNAQLSDVLGTKVDRLGNVIAAPAMPTFFKEGGEVTGGSPSLDEYLKQQMGESQDPSAALFDNAQKLMADFNTVPKVEPMRRVVKRVSRGAGSDSKTDKNMSIKVPPLAASKGMAFNLPSAQEAAEAKSMGTAREQMEELARVYQLKINAAKNKARGLSADTFGAPTLEGPTLVKKSLTKQRFAEGGFVSVLEKGDMSSPAYRAQLEREQGLEGSYPEMIVAPLVKGAVGAARAGLDRILASRASGKFRDLDNARRNEAFTTLTEKEKVRYFGTGQLPDDFAERMKNASAIGAEVGKAPFPIAVPGPKEKRANLKEYLGKTVRDPSARRLLVELEAQSGQEEAQGYAKGGMVNALKGTKAVDKEGRPVMAYRGEYGPSDKLSTELGSYSFGTRDAANLYATEPNNFNAVTEAMKVFPAQLSIRKPLINTPGDPFIDLPVLRKALGKKEFDRVVRENADRIENTNAFEELADAKGYTSVLDLIKKNSKDLDNLATELYPILDDPRAVKALQRRGYDGAIYGGSGATALEPEYRIFSPSQAVSPYGNKPMAPRSARQQVGDFVQSMDMSPTDALGFFGKAASAAGTALTPSTLNEGEEAELARRRAMPPTISRPKSENKPRR